MATDLSHLCKGLLGGSSMSNGNTVSPVPPFAAPGSDSANQVDPRIDRLDEVHDVTSTPVTDHRPLVEGDND